MLDLVRRQAGKRPAATPVAMEMSKVKPRTHASGEMSIVCGRLSPKNAAIAETPNCAMNQAQQAA